MVAPTIATVGPSATYQEAGFLPLLTHSGNGPASAGPVSAIEPSADAGRAELMQLDSDVKQETIDVVVTPVDAGVAAAVN